MSRLRPYQSSELRLQRFLCLTPSLAAGFVGLGGCLVLIGWFWEVIAVKPVLPQWVGMQPDTAIGFVLSGVSLWLVRQLPSRGWRRGVSRSCAIAVLLLGLVTLLQFGLGREPETSPELLPNFSRVGTAPLGVMAPTTALNFCLVGEVLWLLGLRTDRAAYLAQGLTLVTLFVSWQALIGYLYGVELLYHIDSYAPMSVYTVFTFLVLGAGLLCLRPDQAMMRLVTNTRVSGFIARRLLLAVAITPIGLGWLLVELVRSAVISPLFGLSLMVVLGTVIFIGLIWRTVELLDRRDQERQQAESALQESDKRFRRLVEANIFGVAFGNFDGDITYANDAFLEMVGYGRAALQAGQVRWSDMTPPEYKHLDAKGIAELRATGICTPFEKECIRQDGSRVPVLVGRALLQETGDRAEDIVCFYLDLTESKRLQGMQQQTEQELRRANERFELAAAAVRGMIYDWDVPTNFMERTQGLVDLVGIPPEAAEPTWQWWRDRIHPADTLKLEAAMRELLASANSYTIEYRVQHQDGEYRQVWDRAIIERDATGEAVRVVGCNLDVTERYRAEEALRESEVRFRSLADTAPVLIWMAGTDKRCNYVNSTWLNFTGRTLTQEFGNGWVEGVHPDDLQRCLDTYNTAFAAREPFSMDYRLRRFDGAYRWVVNTGTPRYTPDGSFSGYIGSCLEIHDRRQAEWVQRYLAQISQVLFTSLDYQTTLTSVVNLTVPQLADVCTALMTDENGVLQPVATAAARPGGAYWLTELRQHYPFNFADAQGVAQVLKTGQSQLFCTISEALLRESARSPDHLDLLRQGGLSSAMIVPLVARNRPVGVICFYATHSGRNYTASDLVLVEELAQRAALAVDNARLYQIAQQERAKAEAANRSKDDFLATLSHELRTPLNAMLGWTQILTTRQLDSATTQRALETVHRNTRSLFTLIEDLLDVSRIITGKLHFSLGPVDLLPVLDSAIAAIQPTAVDKAIHLRLWVAPDLASQPVCIWGDANRLQQILSNLLSNAVKFTPADGTVEVCLDRPAIDGPAIDCSTADRPAPTAPIVQITVRDTGIGIAPDFLPYVFDRFRQADSSTTRTYGGLGLGLALVRYLVEMQQGTVEAQSAGVGQGATFVVKLPLWQPTEVHLA